MIITVIERDYTNNLNHEVHYIGVPCESFEEAHELVLAHTNYCFNDLIVNYINNGTDYIEVSRETGEVIREFFVRLVN